MANYTFKPAVREQVGLIIGIGGASGSGKTYSALRMASGIVGPGEKFCVIDTENRRALHYAEMFKYDHLDLGEPFRPETYANAIQAADKAGYRVIVVDSMSHEWAGVDGILDWQEEELNRMAGDDWKKRESCKMASWIKPKMAHKHMMQRLLRVNASAVLILCFRAEEKVKMVKDSNNKTQIVDAGWQPICEKNLPYELTVSLMLTPEAPGVPMFLKLQEQHKVIFKPGALINEDCGKAISAWAKGGAKPVSAPVPDGNMVVMGGITQSTLDEIATLRRTHKILKDDFAEIAGIATGEFGLTTSNMTEAQGQRVIEEIKRVNEPQSEPSTAPTGDQIAELSELCKALDMDQGMTADFIAETVPGATLDTLDSAGFGKVIDRLQQMKATMAKPVDQESFEAAMDAG